MTHSITISDLDNTDEFPAIPSVSRPAPSATVLPRPMASTPNVADSGRITFGAGYRLSSK
jgi:hypothetical protein